METQLQVLKQVEENIIGGAGKTGIYSDRKGSDILTEILETTKKNISVVDITSHANSLEELETMLKDKGLRDNIKSELKDDTGKRKRDLKDTKSIIGVNVKSSIEKIAGKAEQDIGRIERFMGTHFKVSRSKYS